MSFQSRGLLWGRHLAAAVGVLSIATLSALPDGGFQEARFRALPSFVYPLMGTAISSSYGMRNHPVTKAHRHHSGIDLAAPASSPIRAVREGRVIFADSLGAYGKLIVVDHGDGFVSRYGHCEALKASIGQLVKSGQIIATVGSTGRTTGPHLHFEVLLDGKPFNPELLIPGLAAEAQG